MNRIKNIFQNIIYTIEYAVFLVKKILSERNFIYFSCIIVSISTAIAVIVLKSFAHNVFVYANYLNTFLKLPFINSILPIVGILLTVFVIKKILANSLEKGTGQILYSVAKKGGIIPKKQMYAQIITSSLTVGLGGSAGLESPIVITGAAFGSNFAQKFKLSKKNRILLLACGVAAGIGAAFNAPIAGVLFAIEVILTDVSISAFIPIIISAASGALVSNVLLSDDVLLYFDQKLTFDFHNTPYYILLGILAGLVSVFHARNFKKVEHYFLQMKGGAYKKAIFGGFLLAVLIYIFPSLFGEGYESIKILSSSKPESLLNNTLLEKFKNNDVILLLFTAVIALVKSVATGLTLGSGGNGGNFAPSLFVGSYLGFFVSKSVELLGISNNLPVTNFTIVGMAGILSGLFHAPLTAIFLIGEITGGYSLLMPLMIVSSISYAVSKRLQKHSFDVIDLAAKGNVFTSNKDKNILQSIDALNLINVDVKSTHLDDSLKNIVEIYSNSSQQMFPIVDEKNNLLGVVLLEDIKTMLLSTFKINYTPVHDVLAQPVELIQINDEVETIIEKFDASKQETLPVLRNGKFVGLLSKCDILHAYRKVLKDLIID